MGIRNVGIIIFCIFLSSYAYAQGISNRGIGTPRLIVKDGTVTTSPRQLVFPDGSLTQNGSSTHVHVLTQAAAAAGYLNLSGSNANQNINIGAWGFTTTGVVDLGGATSFEVPNGASLTLDAAGEVGINSTHKGFAWYDGTQEVFQPSLHILQGTIDLAGWYDSGPAGHEIWLMDLDAGTFPHGIYITAVSVDCSAADPTTEITGDLKYCDAVAGGAFPGGNQTLIVAIDTTTGNMANAAVNTAVASTKSLYIWLESDPVDANTVYHIKITYYIPES